MTAALYFHPEAYTVSGPKLMGRNAAGESFLRGFLKHSNADAFWLQVQRPEHAEYFVSCARELGRQEPVRVVQAEQLATLAQPGCVYYPGPGIGEQAWHRAMARERARPAETPWSLCGITHTTSSAGAMDAIAALLTAPVQPWDALICTSQAVKDNVLRVLQAQADHLVQRLGAQRMVLPQLPVIPLGIHTADFQASARQRADARTALGADEDTLIVLFMGRLSFHAKAHPLAMYRALQFAAERSGKTVLLVECGWHANAFIRDAYATAAAAACPSVRVTTLDGREAAARTTVWAAADVFCSLSDNIQETFGITPLEAMAAGLPVVVSDWDGYRDTVRDGIDGFRIPTLMPQAGLGGDLALRHALGTDNYDMYCGHTCTLVAVDVALAAEAFTRLFESPALRQRMGAAGRERARSVYDWAVIIPQYESLWATLADLRARDATTRQPRQHPWPARLDPFHAFATYPTHTLTPQTLLKLTTRDWPSAARQVAADRALKMVEFARQVLPTQEDVEQVLLAASYGPRAASELVAGLPPARQASVFRGLAWLIKLGVLSVVYASPGRQGG